MANTFLDILMKLKWTHALHHFYIIMKLRWASGLYHLLLPREAKVSKCSVPPSTYPWSSAKHIPYTTFYSLMKFKWTHALHHFYILIKLRWGSALYHSLHPHEAQASTWPTLSFRSSWSSCELMVCTTSTSSWNPDEHVLCTTFYILMKLS
jgi:hypothetical protein